MKWRTGRDRRRTPCEKPVRQAWMSIGVMNHKRNPEQPSRLPDRQTDIPALREHHVRPPQQQTEKALEKTDTDKKQIADIRQHNTRPKQLAPQRQRVIAAQFTGMNGRNRNRSVVVTNNATRLRSKLTVTPKAYLGPGLFLFKLAYYCDYWRNVSA